MTGCKILDAAIDMALEVGFNNVRRDAVAQRAGCATGMVNYVYKNMDGLRTAIMEEAIESEHISIIAQGLAQGDPTAMSAPARLKSKALSALM
jgi:AcrR family transcriptional regulator